MSFLYFEDLVRSYENTADSNDRLFESLKAATATDPLLASHRAHVEEHGLGFGFPAFHAMWMSLLECAARRFKRVRALEIGVFKGQVISLWSLIARERGLDINVHALTPLEGQPGPGSSFCTRLRYYLDRNYRESVRTKNFYPTDDYEAIVRQHYTHYGLDFDDVRLHRGYSTAPAVLAELSIDRFEIVYVDGDHREAVARHDFSTFGAKVVPGGWLVADDAACDLPGTKFWKGYPEVTMALSELGKLGFVNVLNVGHNRIFEKQK